MTRDPNYARAWIPYEWENNDNHFSCLELEIATDAHYLTSIIFSLPNENLTSSSRLLVNHSNLRDQILPYRKFFLSEKNHKSEVEKKINEKLSDEGFLREKNVIKALTGKGWLVILPLIIKGVPKNCVSLIYSYCEVKVREKWRNIFVLEILCRPKVAGKVGKTFAHTLYFYTYRNYSLSLSSFEGANCPPKYEILCTRGTCPPSFSFLTLVPVILLPFHSLRVDFMLEISGYSGA